MIKAIFFLVLTILFSYSQAYAGGNKPVQMTCRIDLNPNNGSFWRKDNNLTYTEQIVLPLSADVSDHQVIFQSDEINAHFHRSIVFLGNATVDPLTGRRKIFIGIYQASDRKENIDKANLMFSLPFTEFYKKYDGKIGHSTQYGLPIVSAVSDSGSLEIFTGDYFNGRFKMSCKANGYDIQASSFDPLKSPRERFSCNINLKNAYSKQTVNELSRPVILGFSTEDRNDLQPIIEDNMFEGLLTNIRVMGNLYINQETLKPEFLLGIYRMSKLYDPKLHAGFHIPKNQTLNKNGNPNYYAVPVAEIRTESDYAELRTRVALDGYRMEIECKKINNSIEWTDKI